MEIVIKVTPRLLERVVLISLIILFLFTTIHYAHKYDTKVCNLPEVKESSGNVVSASATKETEEVSSVSATETKPTSVTTTVTEEETIEEEEETTTTTTSASTASLTGKFDILVGPLQYDVKANGAYYKAIIDDVTFTISNGLTTSKTLKINVYFWDSSSSNGFMEGIKDTIYLPTIESGQILTKTFDVENLNLYNLDLTKTFKFEFVDTIDDSVYKTVVKTLEVDY